MKISAAFPSNYLKAADLQDRNVTVRMSHVKIETLNDDEKPVLYFVGKEKGIVLNKTNATNIAIAYGDDTAEWRDKEIILFPTMVDFQGRSVEAIRVKVPKAKAAQKQDPISTGKQQAPARDEAAMDDDIPF